MRGRVVVCMGVSAAAVRMRVGMVEHSPGLTHHASHGDLWWGRHSQLEVGQHAATTWADAETVPVDPSEARSEVGGVPLGAGLSSKTK